MVFVFEREKRQKNDNWNFWIWVFLSKNGRFVTHNFFPQKIGWNPYFYSVFGCAFSGPRCQKRQFVDTLLKKKNLTDNWKVFFWYFCVFFFFFLGFFCFFFCFFFVCFFCFVFFGGFKGQVRWPKGPPHLALNPPYLIVFVFLLFFCLIFFGGFKGQVRWPKGPPHLALNPLYFPFVFLGFGSFSLLSFLCFFNRQKTCFPPRKGHFLFIFNVSLSFSLNIFWPPPFSVSVSLSLSLSFSCLSLFLLVFLFAFFLFLVLSLFSFFFLLCFCFMKRTTWTFSIAIYFFPEICSLSFGFLSCFFFPIPFSYLVSFLILRYVFCSTSMFLVSKKQSWETPVFGQTGSCNKTGFLWTCVLENVKSYRFILPFFCQILVDVQKTL